MTQYNANTSASSYTEAFYSAYKAGYEHVLQEMKDVYAGVTRMDSLEGERKAYDFVGTIDFTQKGSRFADVPISDITHNRRWMVPSWYEAGVYIDDLDKIALHTDPQGDYIQALAKGAIRKKNDVVYAAFEATVQGGKDYGDNTYAFNDTLLTTGNAWVSAGARTIPHDATNGALAGGTSSGLTIEKLILAREALVTLKNDPNQIFNIVCNQRQISDLFREAEAQSLDTSPFQALANGQMLPFHGFRFIIDWNITLGATNNDVDADTKIYPCYAFTNDAILVAMHQTPVFKVDWLPQKQIWQIYSRIGVGAIRMDEDRVIKIECANA